MKLTAVTYPANTCIPAFKNLKSIPKTIAHQSMTTGSNVPHCYIPELFWANKSAKESAKVFANEQKIINIFKTGNKNNILDIIDKKGTEYVNKARKAIGNNSLVTYAFLNNSADVINSIIDKIGLNVLLTRQDGCHNSIEMACMYNNNPEIVELIYDRVSEKKGLEYTAEQNETNNYFSLITKTFMCNSANVIQQLINKFGKEIFLTSQDGYINPVEAACRYNKSPDVAWLMYKEFQGQDTYTKSNTQNTDIKCIYARNNEGKEIPVENPIFVYNDDISSPLFYTAKYNKNPDVIEHIYNKLNDDKIAQYTFVEDVFKYNPQPETIERLIDTLGKDEIMKTRTNNIFNCPYPNYLDRAFLENKEPKVIEMLIDKLGVEALTEKNPKMHGDSILYRYFSQLIFHIDDRTDVTKKIVEKLGPIVIRYKSAYPLSHSKHPRFDKLFGRIVTEKDCKI